MPVGDGQTNLALVKNNPDQGVGDLENQDQQVTTDNQDQGQTETQTQTPTPPSKFWGQFENENQARIAFEQIRGVLQSVVAEKQQAEYERQQKLQAEQRKKAQTPLDELPIEPDEKLFLERYTNKVNSKQFTEALLLLKRDIEAKSLKQSAAIAQQIAARIVDGRDAPRRSKEELLGNPDLADIHPVADAAILLDQALAPHGFKKADVLTLIRNIQAAAPKKKSLDMETPSKTSWADLSDNDLEKQARSYWKGRLGIKK